MRPGHKKSLPLHALSTASHTLAVPNFCKLKFSLLGTISGTLTCMGSGRNVLPCSPFSKKKDPLNSVELGPEGMSQGKRRWLLLVCPQEARLGTGPEGILLSSS